MKRLLIRLDDACEYITLEKWELIEKCLDSLNVKPLVGIIPAYNDNGFKRNKKNLDFWNRAKRWKEKGWDIALHGYDHVCITNSAGINPLHKSSEFAGVPYEIQKKKISDGYQILKTNGVKPIAFFAPLHTFDQITIKALLEETDIRIISDTIASKPYKNGEMFFFPQQVSRLCNLPVDFQTICLHPENMSTDNMRSFEQFLRKYASRCVALHDVDMPKKDMGCYDKILRKVYFANRRNK